MADWPLKKYGDRLKDVRWRILESVQMDNQEVDGRLAAKRSMEIDLRM